MSEQEIVNEEDQNNASGNEEESTNQTSHLEMSDEDMGELSLEAFEAQANTPIPKEEEAPDGSDKNGIEQSSEDGKPAESSEADAGEQSSDQREAGEQGDEGQDAQQDRLDKVDPDTPPKNKEEKKEEGEDKKEEPKEVDYKAEYEKLTAPFRANNRDMQVANTDDAITLMKMGANYNKKMAGMKPHLKIIRMLDNQGLLDEEKLSYLIDLNKRDPSAVEKLVKDSGINPLDIDTEKPSEYTPQTYTVGDKEVELDMVLDDIRDTPSFENTIDIVGNKWDADSKQALLETPALIRAINDQVASGIYEQITSVVDTERMMGRLAGVSDLQAYKMVGDKLQAEGKFDNVTNEQSNATGDTVVVPPRKDKQPDPKLIDRKKAAGNTKSAPAEQKNKANFDPLSLSDEEFEKLAGGKF